jgi:hypothetical protein
MRHTLFQITLDLIILLYYLVFNMPERKRFAIFRQVTNIIKNVFEIMNQKHLDYLQEYLCSS